MAARKKAGVTLTPERGMAVIGTLLALPLAGIAGFLIKSTVSSYDLATKPYVDEGLKATRGYVDEKSSQTLERAFEHSDQNKQMLHIRMQEIRSEQREQTAKIETKVDMILDRLPGAKR